jgi:pimeloyl-ACP methyl ester carboxylesterase
MVGGLPQLYTDVSMPPSPSAPVLVASNGVHLCCESFGPLDAPPIVLVMGLGAQMIAWDEAFCLALVERGYRVIRFDNRDIGKSTRLDQFDVPNTLALMAKAAIGMKLAVPYTLADMANDTVGLMDALGLARAHVVGASMGGGIVQEMAMRRPDRLLSMTSIMSSTGDPKLPPPTAEATALLFSPAPLQREAYIAHHAKMLKTLRGPHFGEDTISDRDRAAQAFDRGLNPPGVARQLAAIFASGNRTAALAGVKTRTLVIHGDADPLIRVEGGQATAKAIAGARLEIIPGMGHSLPRPTWPRIIDTIADHAR